MTNLFDKHQHLSGILSMIADLLPQIHSIVGEPAVPRVARFVVVFLRLYNKQTIFLLTSLSVHTSFKKGCIV